MAIDTTARKRKRTKKKHTHKRWPRYGDLSLSISSSFRVYKQEKQSCASALLCYRIHKRRRRRRRRRRSINGRSRSSLLVSRPELDRQGDRLKHAPKKNERRSSSIKSYSITIKINFNFFEDFFLFKFPTLKKEKKKKFIFVLFALICSDITEYRAKRRKKNRNVGTHVLS